MTNKLDEARRERAVGWKRQPTAMPCPGSASDIPKLVSEVYDRAPVPLRTKLLECLLRPVGPLALVTIAAGAFARFLCRLTGEAVPIALEDVARVTASHVMELARYVEQSNPAALLRFGALIADRPIGFATLSGSALLRALDALRRREPGPPDE